MSDETFYSKPVNNVLKSIYRELPKQDNPFLFLVEVEDMIEQVRLHMKNIATHQKEKIND